MEQKYVGTVRGVFTKRQTVVATSFEEAVEKLKGNTGKDIEESLTGWVEVEDVEEFDK